MTAAQSFKIYEILGKHFNNAEDAKIVVTEIEQIIESKIADQKDVLATKEDIAKMETKLGVQIAEVRADIIKWMFIFGIGQLATIIAIAKFFFHQ